MPDRKSRFPISRIAVTFMPALRRHWAALAVSYGCTLLAVGVELLAPWPLKILIDSVLGGTAYPVWMSAAEAWPSAVTVAALAMATIGIAVAVATLGAWQKVIDARVREKMTLELRDRTLAHLQTQYLALSTEDRSGELVMRLVDDVYQTVRLMTKTAPIVVRHLVTVGGTLGAMTWLDWRLGLLGLVLLFVLVLISRYYARPLGDAAKQKRQAEGGVAGFAQEAVRGMTSVQALGAEDSVRQRFQSMNAVSLRAGVDETRVAVAMERSLQIASGLAVACIVLGGGLLVLDGRMTVGTLTVAAAYMLQLLKPTEKVNELAATVARGIARAGQLLNLLDRPPQVLDDPDATRLERCDGRLELLDVSFSYSVGNGRSGAAPVLNRVSLTLPPKTLTVVTGPSGAGKSTFVGLLLRLFDPTSGKILLDGLPLPAIRRQSLRAQFAVMTQQSHLFAGRIRDALEPFQREVDDATLWAALDAVALAELVRSLPEKLDTVIGENGANLSGGQCARLSLARALLLDRPILVLDEPLANVDPESQQIIVETLARERRRRTCIAVTHQMALTAIADRVLRLGDGAIRDLPRTDEAGRVLEFSRGGEAMA